jgi:hypothetical protein
MTDFTAMPTYLDQRQRSMRSDSAVQFGCMVLALIAVAVAGMHQPNINQQRKDLQLVLSEDFYEGMPPDLVLLSSSLGSFRGLAVDLLSIRAETLKQEGKYYESMQLSDWLCRLQPRFPSVWSYHAWNMSYNISVGTYSPEERWRWVYAGVKLLRDRGIPYNPKAVGLYRELGWIYFHKMGDILDDFHPVYKKEWAGMIERVLGPPAVPTDSPEYIEIFRKIVEAPRSLKQLIADQPEVAALVERLNAMNVPLYDPGLEELTLAKDKSFLSAMAKYAPGGVLARGTPYLAGENQEWPDDPAVIELVRNPEIADARAALTNHLRSAAMREVFKIDLDKMLGYMEKYGPMDLRGIYPHSLYWSLLGLELSEDVRNVDKQNLINTQRDVFFSLAQLFKQGSLIYHQDPYEPYKSYFESLPNLSYVDAFQEAYVTIGKNDESLDYRDVSAAGPGSETTAQRFVPGHINLLRDAITLLYLSGEQRYLDKAQYYYSYLRETYGSLDATMKEPYTKPLKDFIDDQFDRLLEINKNASSVINQFNRSALFSLATGNRSAYRQKRLMARKAWATYRNQIDPDRYARQELPQPDIMLAGMLTNLLTTPALDPVLKATLWNNLSDNLEIQQRAYDDAITILREECKSVGFDPAKAFPEPPGMEAFRKNNAPKETLDKKPDVIEIDEGAKGK